MPPKSITRERAEWIARHHPCSHCLEYTFKKLVVKPASAAHTTELKVAWIARRVCGVCGLDSELGLDEDGDVVFGG